jgi:putative transposase
MSPVAQEEGGRSRYRRYSAEFKRERASYGFRRVTAVVNRSFGMTYNRKRIRRVMALYAWTLPRPAKRRWTRAHRGTVARPRSNERWSSDAIEIACWNGDVVEAAFALDCGDRECLAYVAANRALAGHDVRTLLAAAVRSVFGDAGAPLSDNGSMYTALDTVIAAERVGLTPITTPVRSPQSNGISEAFHHTLRRDYLAGADLSRAAVVLDQLPHSRNREHYIPSLVPNTDSLHLECGGQRCWNLVPSF